MMDLPRARICPYPGCQRVKKYALGHIALVGGPPRPVDDEIKVVVRNGSAKDMPPDAGKDQVRVSPIDPARGMDVYSVTVKEHAAGASCNDQRGAGLIGKGAVIVLGSRMIHEAFRPGA